MSIRKVPFVTNEYYHIFNRGIDKRIIFDNQQQMYFFFNRLQVLNTTNVSKTANDLRNRNKDKILATDNEKLVDIVSYCLLPNHYHLVVKQIVDGGISKFMHRLGTSYTTYYNQINKRSGGLFQGKFKANHITGEFSLPKIATYVNLNYKHHNISPQTELVKSSIFEYLHTEQGVSICNPEIIEAIISELGGQKYYQESIKNFSIAFAYNKGVELDYDDFEF